MGIQGIAFPFAFNPDTGGVATQNDDTKLQSNIVHLLMTGMGERVMRRTYGAGLRQLVQDPNNDALWAVVQHQTAKAIGLLEPRVLVQQLSASQSGDGATVVVSISYIVRNTKQVQKLSVPIGLGGI
jgi:uncharacterized protein